MRFQLVMLIYIEVFAYLYYFYSNHHFYSYRNSGISADSNNSDRDHRAQVHSVQARPLVQGDRGQELPAGR